MAKSKITDLRDHLFETLTALRDKDHPMDVNRARAVAEVAKVVIETAKVEVEFLKVRGGASATGFLTEAEDRDTEASPVRAALEIRAGGARR